jgi:hypothetical protein
MYKLRKSRLKIVERLVPAINRAGMNGDTISIVNDNSYLFNLFGPYNFFHFKNYGIC